MEEMDVQVVETVMDAQVVDVTAVTVDKVAEASPLPQQSSYFIRDLLLHLF
jgi:hypothetical protein